MKNLKLTFLAFFALAFSFISCSKNDDNPNPNSFNVNGSSYVTNYATFEKTNGGGGYYDLKFINKNLSSSSDTLNVNIVSFNLKISSLPASATLNLKKDSDPAYSEDKNFFDVVCGYKLTYSPAIESYIAGTFLGFDYNLLIDSESNTLTITKNNDDTYSFSYKLKFVKDGQTTNVAGYYKGQVVQK